MITIRHATQNDVPALLTIYNYAVRNLTAIFETQEQTLEERLQWFSKFGRRYPLLVAESNGEVAGYSCLSPYSEKTGYNRTGEISVYLSPEHQGKGIGNLLLKELIRLAEEKGFHAIIAAITGGNETSVKLHKKHGFVFAGCLKETGWKYGEWHDVHFYQLILNK